MHGETLTRQQLVARTNRWMLRGDCQNIESRRITKLDRELAHAMRPGREKRCKDDTAGLMLNRRLEKLKAGVETRVEHPFRVIKENRLIQIMKVSSGD
jgi:hypothetical protein